MKAGFTQSSNGIYLRLKLDPFDLPPEVGEWIINQRLMVAIVPMPDDMPEPTKRELEDGERSIRFAGLLCKDEDFQSWAGTKLADRKEAEAATAVWLRKQIGVVSRSELKTSTGARKRLEDVYARYFKEASAGFD